MPVPAFAIDEDEFRRQWEAGVTRDEMAKNFGYATPFSIIGCTSAEQLVGKFTLPKCTTCAGPGVWPLAATAETRRGSTPQILDTEEKCNLIAISHLFPSQPILLSASSARQLNLSRLHQAAVGRQATLGG